MAGHAAFLFSGSCGIPVLAMTANAFPEDIEKSLEAGMDGHIAKPPDAKKMFRAIAETLDKRL